MTRNSSFVIRNSDAGPAGVGWIAGDELGVSDRRVNQLYHELRPLGAARKDASVYLFQRGQPVIRKLIARAAKSRSMTNLDDCAERQRAGALRKERLILVGRREIRQRMSDTGCGRTVAVEWFCKIRVDFLSQPAHAGARGLLDWSGGIAHQSFRRWDSAYAKGGLRGLIDRRGGRTNDDETFTPEAQEYCKAFWLDDRRLSARLCWELTCVEAEKHGWRVPSYRTTCKWLNKIPRVVRTLAREGVGAYDAKHAPRVKRDRSKIASGDHYCGDECTLDLYARAPDGKGGWKRVRPILTAWQCERSRVFVGWQIDDRANSDTILAAFKMACRERGVPRHVTIDNGKDYTCAAGVTNSTKRSKGDQDRVAGVFAELGIGVTFCIPYNPQSKLIEANFKTVHGRFDKSFDSYCGGSPERRPEGATAIPLHALPAIDEVREKFAAWLADTYHLRKHGGDGMFGYTPQEAWDQFRPPVRRERIDGARLDYLCCRFVGPRTVGKYGVQHRGIGYGQDIDALHVMQGEKVWLRLDPERADFVWICDHPSKRALFQAPANIPIDGATQEDLRDAQRTKGRRRKIDRAYMETAHVDTDTSTDAILRAMAARAKSERTRDLPAPPPAESVQLVRPDLGDLSTTSPLSSSLDSLADDDGDDTRDDDRENIYSAFADIEIDADDDQEDDDGGGYADLANIDPAEDEPDNDADGFATLADLVDRDRSEEARYGTAG